MGPVFLLARTPKIFTLRPSIIMEGTPATHPLLSLRVDLIGLINGKNTRNYPITCSAAEKI